MMRTLILITFVFLLPGIGRAQPLCGFDHLHQQLMQQNSSYNQSVLQTATQWSQWVQTNQNAFIINTPNGPLYEIPVVIHVIHTGGATVSIYNPSDAQLVGMVDYLNQTYAATWASYPNTSNGGTYIPLRFVLAKRDPNCNPTTGIVRVNGSGAANYTSGGIKHASLQGANETTVKDLSRWPNTEYYNIWVVNKIDGQDGTSGQFIAGYAYFPGAAANVDGTVMLATQSMADKITLPHEIGHAFSLYHTFEGDGANGTTCPPNANCTTDGDKICDTEPHKRSLLNCPGNPNPCTGNSYNFVQHNFMDYSNCQDRFTPGQRDRVIFCLLNQRASLVSSLGGTAPDPLPATACVPTNGNPGNNAGPRDIIFNDLNVTSSGYTGDGNVVYINKTCLQRANLVAGSSYTLSVKTSNGAQKVRVYIDYNNDGDFTDPGELIYTHDGTTSTETHSTTYTVPSAGINMCMALRMRVVAVPSSVALVDPCGSLMGQAEDYSVYVRSASTPATAGIALTGGTNPSCSGTPLTFTATPGSGTVNPVFTWLVNGVSTAVTGTTYTSSALNNNDIVSARMKYSSACAADSVLSNTITVQRTTTITPTISIAVTAGSNPGCAGQPITFTATGTNQGTAPAYQWKVNGTNVTGSGNTFTSSTLANNDIVSCQLTSNSTCASPVTANSNNITYTTTTAAASTASIALTSGSNPSCTGTSLTFTATPGSGAGSPVFTWFVNGVSTGITGITYTSSALNNNDIVSARMKYTHACGNDSVFTNSITLQRTATVAPTASIALTAGSNPGCAGQPVTFTATPGNGGSAPAYQWKVNGTNVTGSGNTFTSSTLANNDIVSCQLTSNSACASPVTANSNNITYTTTTATASTASIALTSGSNPSCTGTSLTFTATPGSGAGNPVFTWFVNGVSTGITGTAYTASTFADGNIVKARMKYTHACGNDSVFTNSITLQRTATVAPTVSIALSAGSNPGCAGQPVTFTATPGNGGSAPAYQWKVNGANVTGTGNTFTSSTLANNDIVSCQLTSNATCASPSTVSSNSIAFTTTTTTAPSASIALTSGSNPSCTGTALTFTANPGNGAGNPVFTWFVNGVSTGVTGTVYTASTFANGDIVKARMKYTHACGSDSVFTNSITLQRTATVAPTVSIALTGGSNPSCSGAALTFTATVTNGGNAPVYQWLVNGGNAGSGGNTFTSSTLTNGAVVSCQLTSSSACAVPVTVSSNSIAVSIITVTPSTASIALTGGSNPSCTGTPLTFTTTPGSGAGNPVFTWFVNGVSTGITGTAYTASTFANGDVVKARMKYTHACGSDSVFTNSITVQRNTVVTPAVSIALTAGNNPGCAGQTFSFSATGTNGGTSPAYQWKVNGVNVPGTGAVFTSSTLADGDVVSCQLTSNAGCTSSPTAGSNSISLSLTNNATPIVTITGPAGSTACVGKPVTFTATPVNGGSAPQFQWLVNGAAVSGATGSSFTSSSLGNNAAVSCAMTSGSPCVTSPTDTSNTITITIQPLAATSISMAITRGSNPGCKDSLLEFTAAPVNLGTAPDITWLVDGLPAATGMVFSSTALQNNEMVMVRGIATSTGCRTSDTSISTSLTVVRGTPPPPPVISFIGSSLFVNTIPVQWYGPSGLIPGATGQMYQPTQPGIYYAVALNAGCPSAPSNKLQVFPVQVNTLSLRDVTLFPNPTTGRLTLSWSGLVPQARIRVINSVGQVVLHDTVDGRYSKELDLSALSNGVYLIRIEDLLGRTGVVPVTLRR